MTVETAQVIDLIGVDAKTGRVVLTVSDLTIAVIWRIFIRRHRVIAQSDQPFASHHFVGVVLQVKR